MSATSRTSSRRTGRSFRRASREQRLATRGSSRSRLSARAFWRCCRIPTSTRSSAMQIILLEKVVNLGGLGDVVKVRDGFARNYLIPQGKAKRATRENLAEFEQRRTELEKAQAAQLNDAQSKAAQIDGQVVQIAQKAGVDGKLFGSVTNADVAEALKKKGFDVTKASVRMPQGPLKNVGEYPLKIALHTDV